MTDSYEYAQFLHKVSEAGAGRGIELSAQKVSSLLPLIAAAGLVGGAVTWAKHRREVKRRRMARFSSNTAVQEAKKVLFGLAELVPTPGDLRQGIIDATFNAFDSNG